MYVPTCVLLLFCWLVWSWSRAEARREEDAARANSPHARYMAELAAFRRTIAVPGTMPTSPPQPTVWGPGKPWKTEAVYRNAVQVAQWEKARRLAPPAA
jgi:hypothetical protein